MNSCGACTVSSTCHAEYGACPLPSLYLRPWPSAARSQPEGNSLLSVPPHQTVLRGIWQFYEKGRERGGLLSLLQCPTHPDTSTHPGTPTHPPHPPGGDLPLARAAQVVQREDGVKHPAQELDVEQVACGVGRVSGLVGVSQVGGDVGQVACGAGG